jgi:hypothetical protein
MRLDEAQIDLHGFLRAFYSCQSLGRSFVMDHNIQRPIPSYANFEYSRKNYSAILKEILQPLGLKLVQGKWVDAVVVLPPEPPSYPSFSQQVSALPIAKAFADSSGSSDSVSVLSDTVFVPLLLADSVSKPRPLRARASGLLKSSARRMGWDYNELLIEASPSGVNRLRGRAKVNQLWHVAARASDSLCSLDFARIVDFVSGDTSRVVFGGETRRADSDLSSFGVTGSVLTSYTSVFDGLTVEVKGERWSFVWRGSGSVLEVPGMVGSCASGSSKVAYVSAVGVPFLSQIPFLRYFFSWENKEDDELLVTVCVEVQDG